MSLNCACIFTKMAEEASLEMKFWLFDCEIMTTNTIE